MYPPSDSDSELLPSKPVSCPLLQLLQQLGARPSQVEFTHLPTFEQQIETWETCGDSSSPSPWSLGASQPSSSSSQLSSRASCSQPPKIFSTQLPSSSQLQPKCYLFGLLIWPMRNRKGEIKKWVGKSSRCSPADSDWHLIRDLFTTMHYAAIHWNWEGPKFWKVKA